MESASCVTEFIDSAVASKYYNFFRSFVLFSLQVARQELGIFTMGSVGLNRPERTLIGGTLDISRMINGLWQRAGGHDQNTDMEEAVNVMEDT